MNIRRIYRVCLPLSGEREMNVGVLTKLECYVTIGPLEGEIGGYNAR